MSKSVINQLRKKFDKYYSKYKNKNYKDIINSSKEAYQKELGSLVELFGHLQSSAGEAAVQFSGSLTGPQYGVERVAFLNDLTAKMSETTELPTIREIEGLWFELQREMIASGQVVSFDTNVIDPDGESSACNVTRVGLFNAVCDGKYLEYIFHIAIDSPLVIPFLSPPPGNTITLSILSTILFFPEREDAPASL